MCISLTGFILITLFASTPLAAENPGKGFEDAAIAVAFDYMEGWYQKDAERMKRALHPRLVKRRKNGPELYQLSPTRLIEKTAEGGGSDTPESKRAIQVEVLDVFEDIACVRVESVDFYEYMQLGKFDGQWKIVNILWRTNKGR